MSFQRLKDFLNSKQAKYSFELHSPAYTSLEVAERAHVHGMKLGKVVVINMFNSEDINGEFALCLLPAHYHIDCDVLAKTLAVDEVAISMECDFVHQFPQCETGAIPPFSELWNLPVYMSFAFDMDQDIFFNAGNWSEFVRMPCAEYFRVEQPQLISEGIIAPGITPPKVSIRRGREVFRQH